MSNKEDLAEDVTNNVISSENYGSEEPHFGNYYLVSYNGFYVPNFSFLYAQEYMKQLQTEHEEWINLKIRARDMDQSSKQKLDSIKPGEIDYSLLNEEEMQYINNGINFEQVLDKLKELQIKFLIHKLQNQKLNYRKKNILNHMDEKIKIFEDEII